MLIMLSKIEPLFSFSISFLAGCHNISWENLDCFVLMAFHSPLQCWAEINMFNIKGRTNLPYITCYIVTWYRQERFLEEIHCNQWCWGSRKTPLCQGVRAMPRYNWTCGLWDPQVSQTQCTGPCQTFIINPCLVRFENLIYLSAHFWQMGLECCWW